VVLLKYVCLYSVCSIIVTQTSSSYRHSSLPCIWHLANDVTWCHMHWHEL